MPGSPVPRTDLHARARPGDGRGTSRRAGAAVAHRCAGDRPRARGSAPQATRTTALIRHPLGAAAHADARPAEANAVIRARTASTAPSGAWASCPRGSGDVHRAFLGPGDELQRLAQAS